MYGYCLTKCHCLINIHSMNCFALIFAFYFYLFSTSSIDLATHHTHKVNVNKRKMVKKHKEENEIK